MHGERQIIACKKKRSDCLTASKNYFLFLLPTKYSTARSPAALLKIRYSFSTLLVNFPIYVTPFLVIPFFIAIVTRMSIFGN